MRDSIFIDTNIFVYAFIENKQKSEDQLKHEQSKEFLSNINVDTQVSISTQVCSEYYNALLKNKIDEKIIESSLKTLMKSVNVLYISEDTILKTMDIKSRYKLSYWDSLIISTALENACSILYSEDMQNGLVVENRLKIINPLEISKRI
ncbi:MAG: PIN domain-containing protein [Campylobacterales bacterium]